MSKDKNKLIPELRFPEFVKEGEWEEMSIGYIAISESSSMALNKLELKPSGYPVYGADSIVGYIDEFQQEENYISIVKDGSGVGRLNLCKSQSSILGTLACLKSKDKTKYNLIWVYYLLNAIDFSSYIKGSGIPHIYYSDFKNEIVAVPKPDEQQKIASCLSSLDEVIAAHSQKLDALKEHKKGLMQNLFPQEGETVPKFRFPEFVNDVEWVEKSLGEVCLHFKGFPFQSKDYTSSGRRIVRVSDMGIDHIKNVINAIYIKEDNAELYEKWKLKKDDLIITTVGSKPPVYDSLVGRTIVVKSKDENSLLNQNAVCLRANQNIKQVFLNTLFSRKAYISFIESIIRGNANQGSIALEDLFKYIILHPLPKEQKKIAGCLSSLDALIMVQKEKLEQLKLHKKGLMQGLFPKIND